MGVARDIEKRLEGMMEGFFTKVFRSGLQPVEVGRRILREMEENRTVSVNRTYAPNDFQVFIGPDDFERFEPMAEGLKREFSELIIDKAKERRFNLMGLPKIEFSKEERLGKGEFRVEAALSADPDRQVPPVSTRPPKSADDAGSTRAISSHTADRMGIEQAPGTELIVLDDSGNPRERISVTRSPITIGRLSTNDVVISDSNVSRRHAELRKADGRWTLVDLGSTNGTVVNGKLAREHSLKDGDRISFGTSDLEFRSGGQR
jgi:hypothetical protein